MPAKVGICPDGRNPQTGESIKIPASITASAANQGLHAQGPARKMI
jgi:hypothetical protein